jgi:predicted ester cyclase
LLCTGFGKHNLNNGPSQLKALIAPLRSVMADFAGTPVREGLTAVFAEDAKIKLCHPFGDLIGPEAFYQTAYAPLVKAMPDLERRDLIVLAGRTPEGQDWVGMMGNYLGVFTSPFLGIPPTGHLAHMRYHEFYHFDNGKVVEVQAIWDIPELMMQAGAWPMAPQLGKFLLTPGPMTQDGLTTQGDGTAAMDHVIAMLTDLCRYPADPDPRVMQLEQYWHPRNNWYGPAGIGTNRGIDGFRHWHQIPFLRGMPDRKLDTMGDLMSHWVGEGNYVCESGWPNMRLTLTDDGWMGIAPAGKEVLLRSLDFWRVENGKIRENWVLVDLLDLYRQIGVDVFARLNEFNKARNLESIAIPSGIA